MERIVQWKNQLFASKTSQYAAISIYLLVATLWLHVAERSVIAFLMLLFSFLVLYFANKVPRSIRIAIGLLVFTVLLPVVSGGNQYYMEVAANVGIYIAMALGLNIVVGFAGLLDLGYVAFFAAGAYAYAIFATPQANQFISSELLQFPLSGGWFWLFLFIGMLVAAVFGILLGLPVLKVKGDYLAIVTLGFGEIVRIVFNNLDHPVNITNGARGLPNIAQPELFGMTFTTTHYYYLILFMIAIVIVINKRLERSRLGRTWIAIREDELAAQSVGISLVKTKLLAFATGASFAGVVGVIFAAKMTFIDPTSFILMQSISVLVMVILGGSGSVPGVIVGAAIITVLNVQVLQELSEWINRLSQTGAFSIPPELDPTKFQRLIFGLLLIFIAIFRPNGIIPAKRTEIDLEAVKELDKKWVDKKTFF